MELRNWLTKLYETIDSKDADGFASFITEDGLFRFGNAPAVEGRTAIRDLVAGFFTTIKASEHKIVNAWKNDDVIVWQGEVRYTRNDGSQLTVPFANIFYMEGDLIKEYLIYIDNSQLYNY